MLRNCHKTQTSVQLQREVVGVNGGHNLSFKLTKTVFIIMNGYMVFCYSDM